MCEMTLNERASYIKGLCDGMEIDKTSKEGKVIAALTELISDMAVAIEELEDEVCELRDYIEEIDEDLGEVETVLCEDEYDDGFECVGDCDCCGGDCGDYDDMDDLEYYELDCPSCGETICLDEDFFDTDEDIICPNCGESIDIELEGDEEL